MIALKRVTVNTPTIHITITRSPGDFGNKLLRSDEKGDSSCLREYRAK